MRQIMKVGPFALLFCAICAAAFAGPIPPASGDSVLTSFIVGPASQIHVAWWVLPTGGFTPFAPGLYAYEYQLQNTSVSGVDAFSITLPAGTVGSIVQEGILNGDNLDNPTVFHPAHVPPGGMPLQPLVNVNTTVNGLDSTITWTFNPLLPGNESDTLYFVSTLPPTLGNAVSQDSIPPSPWGSLAVGGQPVPVPALVPEPASVMLLLLGAAGLVSLRIQRRK